MLNCPGDRNFNLNLMVNDHWSLVRVGHGHGAGRYGHSHSVGHVHEEERLIPGVFLGIILLYLGG